MKYRIVIDIECGETMCAGCQYWVWDEGMYKPSCAFFGELKLDDVKVLRDPRCLKFSKRTEASA